jgi:hypothetical protein
MDRMHNVVRVTEAEIFAAKVKLAGLMLLGVVSAAVVAVTGLPP